MKISNLNTWILAAAAGLLLVLLINTSPLARLGITASLPGGWHNAPAAAYSDASCSRKPEGIPFTFKRPNKTQTCSFDVNNLALLLNVSIGIGLGLAGAVIGEKRWGKQ
ncbi:MAG TPA: hypothetical protein VLF62_02310 [Candidatus Saccharimonadales bacterium]|nr:hypothetical protein [Candidatus Saccharimonadales bacterium]